jgi:protein ImuB
MNAPVPRVVTVWCPQWPIAALALAGEVDPEAPVAVVRANRVVARSRAAAHDGVRAGMRRRESQAACSSLVVVDHDPARDSRWFEPVLRSVGDLVPLIEVVAPGRLSFAARGPSRLNGGDATLADVVRATVSAALGSAAQAVGPPGVGVGDGRFTSAVAARLAQNDGVPCVVPVGVVETAEFLAPRSLGALVEAGDVSLDLVDLLRRLGLRRLGDVAALPVTDLLARFGAVGQVLHRLSTGTDDTPPTTAPPPLDLAVTQVFDEPVTQVQAVVFAAKSLADMLGADLSRRGLVCTRLVVEAETEAGERSCRGWYRPSGLSTAAVVERVRWQLEGWATGPTDPEAHHDGAGAPSGGPTSGVVLLRLLPDEVRADDGVQIGFWGGRTQADEWAGRAVARLSGLLGSDAVTVAEWRGGRDPQQAFVLVPATSTDLEDRSRHVVPPLRSGPWPGCLPAPSPAVVHPVPVPVEVVDAEGRPVVVSGRGAISAAPARVRGERSGRVTGWAGPWPVEERWWDTRSRRVARFQLAVRDAGGRESAHLAEVRDTRWWLVAEYA